MFFIKKEITREDIIKRELKKFCFHNIDFKDGSAWLNPSNQHIFNSGWYTIEDFEDLIFRKSGKIVKGETDREKELWFNLYIWEKETKNVGMVYWEYKYFNLVEPFECGGGYEKTPEKTIDLKAEPKEIIKKSFGIFYNSLVYDYMNYDYNRTYNEYLETFWGVKKTLLAMGIGFFGASNTPTEIENLLWYGDIVMLKAWYTALDKQGKCEPFKEWLKYQNEKEDLIQIGLI